jgi:prepilin-type N-terminal cleavage/methylation domain-containing protein
VQTLLLVIEIRFVAVMAVVQCTKPASMIKEFLRGFTLIELMIVAAIVGILPPPPAQLSVQLLSPDELRLRAQLLETVQFGAEFLFPKRSL